MTLYSIGYSVAGDLSRELGRAGAGEAELAALKRLRDGIGEETDVVRLTHAAAAAGLPWEEMFPGLGKDLLSDKGTL